MHILVTGGAGYLGSTLVPRLLSRGWDVDVLDSFVHGVPSLSGCIGDGGRGLRVYRGDVRDPKAVFPLAERADVIIPLAAIVGAPACLRDPVGADEINRVAVLKLCEIAARRRIQIIFPNTNSGYGRGGDRPVDEDSPMNPVSLYGRTKVEAERSVLDVGGTSLRFATLFGFSPRMRLDLMVNDFANRAFRDRVIVVFEGRFRRNFLHVRDAAAAIEHLIGPYGGGVFNAGNSRANMTKLELARRVAALIPADVVEIEGRADPDQRDYLVSNERLESTGWNAVRDIDDGIVELRRGLAMPLHGCSNV